MSVYRRLRKCDDVIRRAHVSRSRGQQATAPRDHCWGASSQLVSPLEGVRSNPSVPSKADHRLPRGFWISTGQGALASGCCKTFGMLPAKQQRHQCSARQHTIEGGSVRPRENTDGAPHQCSRADSRSLRGISTGHSSPVKPNLVPDCNLQRRHRNRLVQHCPRWRAVDVTPYPRAVVKGVRVPILVKINQHPDVLLLCPLHHLVDAVEIFFRVDPWPLDAQ